MRQDDFTYFPQFKLNIIGNHKPQLQNVDAAARRRFNIIPFDNKPVVVDRELEFKLMGEAPAILRWLIDGCLDWQRNGLVRPQRVVEATENYFADQDSFSRWLDECCDCEPGNTHKTATAGELYQSWKGYAMAAGENPEFAEDLRGQAADRRQRHHDTAKEDRRHLSVHSADPGRTPITRPTTSERRSWALPTSDGCRMVKGVPVTLLRARAWDITESPTPSYTFWG